jgi:hypothetical protein
MIPRVVHRWRFTATTLDERLRLACPIKRSLVGTSKKREYFVRYPEPGRRREDVL